MAAVAEGLEEFSKEELLKLDSEGRCIVTDHGHFGKLIYYCLLVYKFMVSTCHPIKRTLVTILVASSCPLFFFFKESACRPFSCITLLKLTGLVVFSPA